MTTPILTFAQAEKLGQEMHDRFVANDVTPPLTRDDMGWADMVQFVMRRAGDLVADRIAQFEGNHE